MKYSIKKMTVLLLLMMAGGLANAQSMYLAEEYYNQGKYYEAAKQLQPLADGGNAKAQVMAAGLFFEGKGVPKNDAQGVKYATLAANQGYEDAIKLLAKHYWTSNPKKAFETLKHYTDRHPYLKKKDIGMMLAECYLLPHGTEKNEALGWQLAEGNEQLDVLIKQEGMTARYIEYQMHKTGKDNLEDYADYLFGNGDMEMFTQVCNSIKRLHPDVMEHYKQRASEGNSFASAMVAEYYYDRGIRNMEVDDITKARNYINGSASRSAYGRSLRNKINFVPATYTITSGFWIYGTNQSNLFLLKIEHKYNKTIFHFNYKAVHAEAYVNFDKGLCALCNGKRYALLTPRRFVNRRTNVNGNDNYFTMEFEAMPTNWSEINLVYNGTTTFQNIRHQ